MTPISEWERCKPWIEASIEVSPFADKISVIEEKIAAGIYRLESSANAACLIEYASYDDKPVLIIRFAGGSLEELLDVIEPRLYEEAKRAGRVIMGEGRLGWMKSAQARGYKLAWITMVKE